ncbi:siderophore-interacting protein [Streptomyces griseoviridis]|uniref:Siderophore-interacting protein n=3 Tax=Streptomyces TaxID=1883 RepID=A0A918GUW0_STRGD|nr:MULTISPECIES: siderophore-interacting protein [Streptomyces]MDP9680382.1 NADPH-dependent ferric siderophore reductase [Streptomyces griseoviridis]GGS67309.1 siderophore-interacting protein [Streptomyces niveoruber]GGT16449.1 siderophore-interacting protein [Streptomyces griseoviridis]GGU62989.1 siderophore-interacting protein [Streptomyces daghestanicus]GHI29094.1 siderophore-interacting protein [Streptomyces daghestanicus]
MSVSRMPPRGPGQGRRFHDTRMLEVRVAEAHDVTPGMRELTLTGPALAVLRSKPGAHLPLEVPDVDGVPRLRTYSVWTHDPSRASLTLRIARHRPEGPGSRWAASVATGTRTRVGAPRNRITLEPRARYHVFIGEETGAVPLLTMLAALPAGAAASGVLETTGPDGDFSAPHGPRGLPWVHRGGASAVGSRVLLEAVRRLRLPPEPGIAYVAGEATTCRAVVRHLCGERAWPRYAVKTQVHWAAGRTGIL